MAGVPPVVAEPSASLRERKKADTRRALILAAGRLTIDHGFHGFTLADIADAAHVSRRTVSNYFAGKAECVVAINDEAIASALEMVAAGSADETIDQLIRRAVRNVNDEIGDHWADLNEVILVEPELRAANALREQQRAADLALAIARRLGIEPDDVAAEALAAYAITAGRIVLERWLVTGRPDGRQGPQPPARARPAHPRPHRAGRPATRLHPLDRPPPPAPRGVLMAFLLYRLGGWSVRHRGWVVAVWLLLLALVGAGAALFGGTMTNSFTIPNTPAQSAIDELGEKIPGAGGSTGRIVFKAPDGHSLAEPEYAAVVEEVVQGAAQLDGVVAVTDPLTGQILLAGGTPAPENPTAQPQLAPPNGQIGFATLQMQGQITDIPEATHEAIADLVAAQSDSGLEIELGGAAVKQAPSIGSTEAIGVVVALIVLLITFGSLIAAGLPMLTALIGIGIGVGTVLILSRWIDMSSTSPILALMLGLAVGIDYALFIVSRHRKQVIAGMPVAESIARATGTAGSAVLFAGLTVFIALAALSVVGIPFLTVMGLAAAFTVMLAVLIALTMLPALLSFTGLRVVPKKHRGTIGKAEAEPNDNRWIHFISRHPAFVLILGVLAVGVIAIPAVQAAPRVAGRRHEGGGQHQPAGLRPARRGLRGRGERSADRHRRAGPTRRRPGLRCRPSRPR